MAYLPETEDFAEGTYQIETSDRVLGGPGGIANKQAEQLGNRTAWLKAAITKIIAGTTVVGKAARLATARTLKLKGAASGSGAFDGAADIEITLTLADSGIVPGAYSKPVFNSKGLATGGTNPSTLADFGITDAYTKTEAGQSFASKASTLAGYNIGDAYTKSQVDGSLSGKADKSTTLAGYGITNAYTKTEVGQSFASKSTTLAGYGITDAYTKTEAGQSFASKSTTLAGYNIGDAYTKTQVDSALSSKADKGTTLAAYGIGDAYTQSQLNILLDGKATKGAATEVFAGTAAVATQIQTNSGTDNATIVTPRKLRAGFLSSFTENGFVAFPTWLGGLIIQWGRTAVLADGSATNVSLPFTFPSTTLQMWTSLYGSVSGDSAACRVSAGQFVSLSQINVSYNETNSALGGSAVAWLCVGF